MGDAVVDEAEDGVTEETTEQEPTTEEEAARDSAATAEVAAAVEVLTPIVKDIVTRAAEAAVKRAPGLLENAGGVQGLSDRARDRVEEAGWRPLRTTHFNALLLPVAAAWRFAERLRPNQEPSSSELVRTPAALNWLLEQPLRAEAALLRSGRRIPAGLSLVGVFAAH